MNNKLVLYAVTFGPLILSLLFHFSFKEIGLGDDYNDYVLFISMTAISSSIVLMGKDIQYYRLIDQLRRMVAQDTSIVVLFGVFLGIVFFLLSKLGVLILYRKELEPLLVIAIPLKVICDYLALIANVKSKVIESRVVNDLVFALVQLILIASYYFQVIGFMLFIVAIITYWTLSIFFMNANYGSLKFSFPRIDYFKTYYLVGAMIPANIGVLVNKSQFILLNSFGFGQLVGVYNIAFNLSNILVMPYNVLTRIELPGISASKSLSKSTLRSVQFKSFFAFFLLFICVILFRNLLGDYFSVFRETVLVNFFVVLSLAQLVNLFVGLRSSLVQVTHNLKRVTYGLVLVFTVSLGSAFLLHSSMYSALTFYSTFVVFSNLLYLGLYKRGVYY